MKRLKFDRKKIQVGVLFLVTFAAGYFASEAYACRRIQATCSYTVTRQVCRYDGCGFCDQYGMPCCYDESGPCIDDPYHQGT